MAAHGTKCRSPSFGNSPRSDTVQRQRNPPRSRWRCSRRNVPWSKRKRCPKKANGRLYVLDACLCLERAPFFVQRDHVGAPVTSNHAPPGGGQDALGKPEDVGACVENKSAMDGLAVFLAKRHDPPGIAAGYTVAGFDLHG